MSEWEQRVGCHPIFSEEDGKMICPEGFKLDPWICPICSGKGCKYCHRTGLLPACKECIGTLRLLEDMLSVTLNREQHGRSLEPNSVSNWWYNQKRRNGDI